MPTKDRAEVESVDVSVQDKAWYSDNYGVYQTSDKELPDMTIEAHPKKPGKTPELTYIEVGKPTPAQINGGPEAPSGAVTVHVPGVSEKGVSVFAGSRGANPVFATEDAKNEKAVFQGLPPGRYVISMFGGISAPGRPPKAVELAAGQKLDVTLEPARAMKLNITWIIGP